MKFSTLLTVLPVSAFFFCAAASAAIDGTDSLEMTFNAELTNTTCTAQIVDAQGNPTNTIDYGEVYKSEIDAKSRIVPFKIVYSACSGVYDVEIDLNPGAGGACSGESYVALPTTSGVAFEIWLYNVKDGTQLTCSSKYMMIPYSLATGSGEQKFESRIVVADGKTIGEVVSGTVSAPITFVVTYN